MWSSTEFRQFFQSEPWPNRIAYVVMLLLALLYLLSQLAMIVMWIAGEAQLDSM